MVALHQANLDELQILCGDILRIKGNEGKDTVCIVLAASGEMSKIKMNEVVRKNLRVSLGDIVSVHQVRAKPPNPLLSARGGVHYHTCETYTPSDSII